MTNRFLPDDDMPDPAHLTAGLAGVAQARAVIVAHLRRMAEAQEPYGHFSGEHLLTRAVWLAAADIIATDGQKRRKKKNA